MLNIYHISAGESAQLTRMTIGNGRSVQFSFGPSGVWAKWDTSEPVPSTVLLLTVLRGYESPEDMPPDRIVDTREVAV